MGVLLKVKEYWETTRVRPSIRPSASGVAVVGQLGNGGLHVGTHSITGHWKSDRGMPSLEAELATFKPGSWGAGLGGVLNNDIPSAGYRRETTPTLAPSYNDARALSLIL